MSLNAKTHIVAFRLNAEEYKRLEMAALYAGDDPNNWVRKLALGELNGDGMTPNERLIYEQVSVVRHLVGHLLKGSLPAEEFEKLKQEVEQHKAKIAASLIAKSDARRDVTSAKRG